MSEEAFEEFAGGRHELTRREFMAILSSWDAPQTDASQTDEPQTDEPQTHEPQTRAPQVHAPQTEQVSSPKPKEHHLRSEDLATTGGRRVGGEQGGTGRERDTACFGARTQEGGVEGGGLVGGKRKSVEGIGREGGECPEDGKRMRCSSVTAHGGKQQDEKGGKYAGTSRRGQGCKARVAPGEVCDVLN